MKKYILLGTLLCTALAFTSCSNEDYKDWAKPQASGDAAEGSAYSYGISMNAGPQAEIVMPVADDDITIATIQSEKTLPFEIKSFTINGKELDIARQTMNEVTDEAHKDGDRQVYRFDFTPHDGSLGYGADWHPSMRQHEKMANELTPYLRKLMHW